MKTYPVSHLLFALLLSTAVGISAEKKVKSTKEAPAKTEAKPAAKKGGKTAAPAAEKAPEAPNPNLNSTEPAAKVNDEIITVGELEKAFDNVAQARNMSPSAMPPEQKLMILHRMLDQMVEDKLVDAASADIKLTDEDIKTELDRITKEAGGSEEALNTKLASFGETMASFKKELPKRVRQRRWVESQVSALAKEVTDAEAKEFYDKSPQHFKVPEMIQASQIIFTLDPQEKAEEKIAAASKKANKALERAKKGEDFAKLAVELSEDPSAKENKGDMGMLSPEGGIAKELYDEAAKLKVGEISDMPLRTQFGLHIIKTTDRKEARTVPFEEAKEKITGYLNNQSKGQAVQQVLAGLREKAKVEVLLPQPEPPATADPIPQPQTQSEPPAPTSNSKSLPVEAVTPPVSAPAVTDPVEAPPAVEAPSAPTN